MLLVTEFTNERGESYTVLQLLKRLRKAIIQIDDILFNHQERIEVLEIDVEEIKNDINGIKEQLLDIVNRVDIVENKVEIVEETLITIENNITSIETILNTHSSDILAINTNVTNITTELNELQGIVDSIPIVSASPLNGYIKIDGIDTPVFIGSVGSGGSGGGEIIAHYTSEGDTSFYGLEKTLIEFDLPDADVVNISGMVDYTFDFIEQITGNPVYEGGVRIYGYDEDGTETVLLILVNNYNNGAVYKYTKNIYNCSISATNCSSSNIAFTSKTINNKESSSINFLSNGMTTVEYNKKIVKIKMKIYNPAFPESHPSKYYINSFDVICSTMGESGGTFKSNKSLLAYEQFGENDYGVYKNVFNYLLGDEITKTIDNNTLIYNFEYNCVYGVTDDIPTVANLQFTVGSTQLNFGELSLSKDAKNKNFILKCEIRVTKNETSNYDVRALMRVFTADPILWDNVTLIKTLFSSETDVVIVPQDNLKFNVMLQNGYLNIGWFQGNPAVTPVKSGSWKGILETDLLTNIIGSD